MPYSQDAVAFAQIPASDQIRLEDRVSFGYLEKCIVTQDRTGVIAIMEEDEKKKKLRIELPVAGLAVLALGPGTSISAPAMISCARAGATVMFCGGGGIPVYTYATALTSTSRWALAQAVVVSNERYAEQAALSLYKKQFGMDSFSGGSIPVMRGMEGRMMRQVYRSLSAKHGVRSFRRDTTAKDSVNIALNMANSLLYGCAASVCAAIGVHPALGFIHRGNARALLFDLADIYKTSITLPAAFSCAELPPSEAATHVRKKIRQAMIQRKLLSDMLRTLMDVLSPHLPKRDDDRLVSENGEEVAGHKAYGWDSDEDDFIWREDD